MNKEITLEEYVLTNLHPGDWGYYIRLKDNIEYQVYKRKPRGQKLYYFIKKDNEEIRLDEDIKKENKLEKNFYNEKIKSDKWRNATIMLCLIMIVYEVVISISFKNLTYIVCAILWGNIALIEYFDNKLIQEKDKIIYEADKLINLQFGIINELTDDLKKLNKVKIMRIKDIIIPKEFQKPRTEKMNERIEYFKKNQNFETQIVVDKDNNLIDGYTTYLIAKKYGINFINVINNS